MENVSLLTYCCDYENSISSTLLLPAILQGLMIVSRTDSGMMNKVFQEYGSPPTT